MTFEEYKKDFEKQLFALGDEIIKENINTTDYTATYLSTALSLLLKEIYETKNRKTNEENPVILITQLHKIVNKMRDEFPVDHNTKLDQIQNLTKAVKKIEETGEYLAKHITANTN